MEGGDSQQRTSSPRPESTIAQSFATELESMFGLSGGVDGISEGVEEKKRTVTNSAKELEELEVRLKETEKRLAKVSRTSSPTRKTQTQPDANSSSSRTPGAEAGASRLSPLGQVPTYPEERPPTGGGGRPQPGRGETAEMMSNMPGQMPETPRSYSGRGDDYVMVDRSGGRGVTGQGQSVR